MMCQTDCIYTILWLDFNQDIPYVMIFRKYINGEAFSMGKIIIETRIDIVDLANVSIFLNKHNILPRTKSELIRLSLGIFIDLIMPNKRVTTVTEALETLAKLGIDYAGTGRREDKNRKALVGNLQLENLLMEGASISDLVANNERDANTLPPEVAAEAVKKYEDMKEEQGE